MLCSSRCIERFFNETSNSVGRYYRKRYDWERTEVFPSLATLTRRAGDLLGPEPHDLPARSSDGYPSRVPG